MAWHKIQETILMFSVHSRYFLTEFLSIFTHFLARFLGGSCLDVQESGEKRLNLQEMSDMTVF